MNKWLKIALVLLVLGIFAGISGYVFIYNKPHINYEKAAADFSLSGTVLFTEYTENRREAEQKYNGKVLEVSGSVSAVENVGSLTLVVFALGEGMFGDEGIRCTMLEKYRENANGLKPGTMIRLKGYCTGYNDTDIILEKCSIIQ